EWEKVADELEKCVELNPKSIVAINNLANAHLLLFEKTRTASHVLRASSLCEQALNELPDDTDNATKSSLWDTLGHCYDYDTSIRDYDRALTCFAQGLKFAGDNPLINAHIGATLIKQNKFAQALPYLETARSLSPDLPDTYKFLGYVYSNLGQTQNAIDNLTTYLAMVPNAVDAPQERKQLDALQARLRGSQADNKEPAATQN
ncbi:MAG TPA: hypothetical protein VEZ90_19380, partial [Blastocatellia bacterium]|nr:hypothetical protein [Blastocatellia bacterium]